MNFSLDSYFKLRRKRELEKQEDDVFYETSIELLTMSNKEQAGSSNIYEIAWAGFVTELSPPKLLLLCLQKRVIIEPRELNGVCLLFCLVATKTK